MIAAGLPFTFPIFTDPPTFASSGMLRKVTETRPFANRFTAVFAAAGSAPKPLKATIAQAPEITVLRLTSAISITLLSIITTS